MSNTEKTPHEGENNIDSKSHKFFTEGTRSGDRCSQFNKLTTQLLDTNKTPGENGTNNDIIDPSFIFNYSLSNNATEATLDSMIHDWIKDSNLISLSKKELLLLFDEKLTIFNLPLPFQAIFYDNFILKIIQILKIQQYVNKDIISGLYEIHKKMHTVYSSFIIFHAYKWSQKNEDTPTGIINNLNWIVEHSKGQGDSDVKYLSYMNQGENLHGFTKFIQEHGENNIPKKENRYIRISSDLEIYIEHDLLLPTALRSRIINGEQKIYPYDNILHFIKSILGGGTPENIRIMFQIMHSPGIMRKIEKDLKIDFSLYPFSIQAHFLRFLSYGRKKDLRRLQNYLYIEHSNNITSTQIHSRIQVFLANGKGRRFGNMILNIHEKLVEIYGENQGGNLGDTIFSKYNDIIDIAEKDANFIQNEYFGDNPQIQFSKAAYINVLLDRANKILEKIRDTLKDPPSQDVLQMMIEGYNAELMQYGSLFLVTQNDLQGTLEEALLKVNVIITELSGPQLNESQKQSIDRLYELNYQNDLDKDGILKVNRERLQVDYQNPKSKFYLFDFHDQCLLSAKFIEQDNGNIYAGAFNGLPQFHSYEFGKFVFRKLVEKYSDRNIEGLVYVGKEKLLVYYAQFGFVQKLDEQGNPLIHTADDGRQSYWIIKRANNHNS